MENGDFKKSGNFYSDLLRCGFPKIIDYKILLKTKLFLEMESFSNHFIKSNINALKNYYWVTDSLHQWSRQWEYPFTYFCILKNNNELNIRNDEYKILDAGSGCTFFPYYLLNKISNCIVYCCDHDASLSSIFNEINKSVIHNINFDLYDLKHFGYKDNFFDVIYCISVLEHTCNYKDIIKEFQRTLKPKGLLIVTFDISLDAKAKITSEIAQELLDEVNRYFEPVAGADYFDKILNIKRNGILTTKFIKYFDKRLLPPWKLTWRSFLKQLLNLKIPQKPFWNMTVFCGAWKKK